MILHESKLSNITYTKDGGEVTARTIIPTYVPNASPLVRAIDVTELSDHDRTEYERLVGEYQEYKDRIMNTMFTFESWASHTYNIDLAPKWRSFKPAKITSS